MILGRTSSRKLTSLSRISLWMVIRHLSTVCTASSQASVQIVRDEGETAESRIQLLRQSGNSMCPSEIAVPKLTFTASVLPGRRKEGLASQSVACFRRLTISLMM